MSTLILRPAVDGLNTPAPSRREIISRLVAMCLVDRRYCELMDRHRDGLVYRVPPLREVDKLARSA